MSRIIVKTPLGELSGISENSVNRFLGIRYAYAERFCYPKVVEGWQGVFNAENYGDGCPQTRTYINQLDNPERRFYHKEFREGESYTYSEDCLNLNIWSPKNATDAPVIVFIHGGGFNSGSNAEKYIDGKHYAERGIIFVAMNYRVGLLGYPTGKSISGEFAEGNFGLYDQFTAIQFIKRIISSFGGDENNITLMGQSAGAISIMYLSLCKQCEGLFQKAILLSGGGLMPSFALAKPPEETREYWQTYAKRCGAKDMSELKSADLKMLFERFEEHRKERKDNQLSCMPVIDGYLLTDSASNIEKRREFLNIPYLISSTKHDMLPFILYRMGKKWAREQKQPCYTAFFDRDLPGDNNKSFHSADLWYAIGATDKCWRPLMEKDIALKNLIMGYYSNFAKTGNPNGDNLPIWIPTDKKQGKCMYFNVFGGRMSKPNVIQLLAITAKNEKYKA